MHIRLAPFGLLILVSALAATAFGASPSAIGAPPANRLWSRDLPRPYRYTDAHIAVAPGGDVVIAATAIRWVKTGPHERTPIEGENDIFVMRVP
jgi:hypothetical protein